MPSLAGAARRFRACRLDSQSNDSALALSGTHSLFPPNNKSPWKQRVAGMAKLEEISRGCRLRGILADAPVQVVDVQWQGTSALAVVYRDAEGRTGDVLLLRSQEPSI